MENGSIQRGKKKTLQSGDKEVHNTAIARLKAGIKEKAKQKHQQRLERDNTDKTKDMWQLIQNKTEANRSRNNPTMCEAMLPDGPNIFSAYFDLLMIYTGSS